MHIFAGRVRSQNLVERCLQFRLGGPPLRHDLHLPRRLDTQVPLLHEQAADHPLQVQAF